MCIPPLGWGGLCEARPRFVAGVANNRVTVVRSEVVRLR
jgi:hypothetical protein